MRQFRSTSATLSPWYYQSLDKICASAGIPAYLRPMWINYLGGDSLHSVAVTGAAIHVQGHQRWPDLPYGRDSAGAGAVSRPGIDAIGPGSGGHSRGTP